MQPKSVEINGRKYQVGRFTFRDIGKVEAFVKSKIPNPVSAVLAIEGISDGDRRFLLENARKDLVHYPPDVNSPEAQRVVLGTIEGHVLLMEIALTKYQPELKTEDIRAIHAEMMASQEHGMRKLAEIFAVAYDADEDASDPKRKDSRKRHA
ncbi:MAG: hypothetical protein JWN86_1778 [Planctomycetota bacterium]|nr:hypothetical protein [Planctomycetota bacterium]